MSVKRIEALLDSMAKLHGFFTVPESEAYQTRNPIGLKSYARMGKHNVSETGCRVFDSALAGYKSALFDLDIKLKGQSRAGLSSDDPLKDLLAVYSLNEPQAVEHIVDFLRRALNDESVSEQTPLSYFVEDK